MSDFFLFDIIIFVLAFKIWTYIIIINVLNELQSVYFYRVVMRND